jgi:hypothetical protein
MSGCISNSEKSDNIAMRRATAGCCARAASGQTEADPAIPLMKSRRRIAFPEA